MFHLMMKNWLLVKVFNFMIENLILRQKIEFQDRKLQSESKTEKNHFFSSKVYFGSKNFITQKLIATRKSFFCENLFRLETNFFHRKDILTLKTILKLKN